MTTPRQTIRCDCCGQEGVAYLQNGKITIEKKSHGRPHVFVLTREVFEMLMAKQKEAKS